MMTLLFSHRHVFVILVMWLVSFHFSVKLKLSLPQLCTSIVGPYTPYHIFPILNSIQNIHYIIVL